MKKIRTSVKREGILPKVEQLFSLDWELEDQLLIISFQTFLFHFTSGCMVHF